MITSEQEFLEFMNANGFTCAEADLHHSGIVAVSTKNLFLCDKKARRFFLVVTACEKNVDLSQLALQLEVSHLRFGSEDNLQRLLGVTRGSVTMMGLVNDVEHRVELWVDAGVWQGEQFLCHPLINTATLVLSKMELIRFFALTGHVPNYFDEQEHG